MTDTPETAEARAREAAERVAERVYASYPFPKDDDVVSPVVMVDFGMRCALTFAALQSPPVAGGSVGEEVARSILADTYPPELAHVRKSVLETLAEEMGQWFHHAIAAIKIALAKPTQPASVSGEVVTQADWDRAEEAFSTDAVSSDKALARLFADHRLAAAPEAATPSAAPVDYMALAAAFGPVLVQAFPNESPRNRMVTADALAEEVRKRESWFATPSAVGGVDRVREALSGVLGLVQLIEARDDLPADLRLALLGNHRLIDARAALTTGATSPEKGAR